MDFEQKEILLWSGTGSRLYSRSCPWFAITKRESEAFGLLGKFAWTPCSTRALDRVKGDARQMMMMVMMVMVMVMLRTIMMMVRMR